MLLWQGMANLRDIRGLDSVSWWPLASGWWLLITITILLLIVVFWHYYQQRWSVQAQRQLRHCLRKEDPQLVLEEFSELIRRIAIAYYGRARCASLTGSTWLAWLSQHDPAGFNWQRRASWLADLPYSPNEQAGPNEKDFKIAILAAIGWIKFHGTPPRSSKIVVKDV